MLLSIIILNYKSKNLTRECVSSILDKKFPFEYEIIVIDNGSHDGVCNMVSETYPNTPVVCLPLPENIGMGPGNNVGFKRARGKYILVLNADTLLQASTVNPLISFLESHEHAGIAAPMLLNPDLTHQVSAHSFPSIMMPFYRRTFLGKTQAGKKFLETYTRADLPNDKPSQVDWVFGPAFMIRKSTVEKIGGYDERFFLFLEDTDLCKQVWEAGQEVWYIPESTIIHYPHRLSGHELGLLSLTKKYTWIHIVSWIKYFLKWGIQGK